MGRRDGTAGCGLLETVVAAGLLVVVVAGVAQLTALSVEATRTSRRDTLALQLAAQKMEQLRSLPWGYDRSGRHRLSDLSTDLTRDPPGRRGVGLQTSPRHSLDRNVSGYVDYLDLHGRWLGTGATPAPRTAFVRRWSIQSDRMAPGDLLVLDVIVLPAEVARRQEWTSHGPQVPGVVRLSTMRVRG